MFDSFSGRVVDRILIDPVFLLQKAVAHPINPVAWIAINTFDAPCRKSFQEEIAHCISHQSPNLSQSDRRLKNSLSSAKDRPCGLLSNSRLQARGMERQDGRTREKRGADLPPGFWLHHDVDVREPQFRECCAPSHNRWNWGSTFHLLMVETQALRFI